MTYTQSTTSKSSQSSASPGTSTGGCGCGCGCKDHPPQTGCCKLTCFERPTYFCGQLLSDADLTLEENYFREKNKLYHRTIDGYGVVCGLRMKCDGRCDGHITIGDGYAIDCCGNDLVVCEPKSFDVIGELRKKKWLLETPEDIPFLAPLIQREIIYRILRTPQGERLRAIATRGDLSNRTARAISWLKANYNKPLHMEELASIARMGVSTLHHQFRALTAMSPLQYQKQLRLQAARQRMLMDGVDATNAAYEVGYESVSQFSREYTRFFGQPPMRDVRTLRLAGTQLIRPESA